MAVHRTTIMVCSPSLFGRLGWPCEEPGCPARSGYQGLARDFLAQVSAAPKKPSKDATPEQTASWEQQRHQQSSARISVEHAIAELKQWRPLQRWTGRRDHFQETALAIADLVSERAATR